MIQNKIPIKSKMAKFLRFFNLENAATTWEGIIIAKKFKKLGYNLTKSKNSNGSLELTFEKK